MYSKGKKMIVTTDQLLLVRSKYWLFTEVSDPDGLRELQEFYYSLLDVLDKPHFTRAVWVIVSNLLLFTKASDFEPIRLWHQNRTPRLDPLFDALVGLDHELPPHAIERWVDQWVRENIPTGRDGSPEYTQQRRPSPGRVHSVRSPGRSPGRPSPDLGPRPLDCVVCLSVTAQCVLTPCGHVILCRDCAASAGPGTLIITCPTCRTLIQGVYPVYF